MFQKKAASTEPNPTRRVTEPAPGTETVIGPGVRVEGDLKSPSGVELLGTVEGSFEVAGLLVVRESGRVIGDVTAQDVIVQGAVEGRVIAAQRIELGSSGRIQGDMRAKAVSIAEGAYFEGKVEMKAPSDSSQRRRKEALVPVATLGQAKPGNAPTITRPGRAAARAPEAWDTLATITANPTASRRCTSPPIGGCTSPETVAAATMTVTTGSQAGWMTSSTSRAIAWAPPKSKAPWFLTGQSSKQPW